MGETDERLAALKKAYAEVMLNTAKESAARILASESKAARLQKNLEVTKDEALRTLLRLKGVMDAKMEEANRKCVGQKRRIYDLESQLKEAQSTIACLKAELRKGNGENEMPKNSNAETLDMGVKFQKTCSEDVLIIGQDICGTQCRRSTEQDVLQTDAPKKCYNEPLKSLEECLVVNEQGPLLPKSVEESSPENDSSGDHAMVSFIMRSKEPEPLKNGCTQRIRALENSNFSNSGTDTHVSKSASVLAKKEKSQNSCLNSSYDKAMSHSTRENGKVEIENRNCQSDQLAERPPCDSSAKRSRAARIVTANASGKDAADHRSSTISKDAGGGSQPEVETWRISQRSCRDSSAKRIRSAGIVTANASGKDAYAEHRSTTISQDVGGDSQKQVLSDICTEECSMELLRNQNELPMTLPKTREKYNLEDVRHEESRVQNINAVEGSSQDAETHEFLHDGENIASNSHQCKTETDLDSSKACQVNGTCTKTTGDRHIKYTFQRKRVRGSSTSTLESIPAEANCEPKRRKTVDEKENLTESRKPALISESSRESRRIAQVARQLISLSEKRW